MDLEGTFFDLERILLHSLPKSGEPWSIWPPGSYVPGDIDTNTILLLKLDDTKKFDNTTK